MQSSNILDAAFCLQLEASCLQWSFFTYSCVLELFCLQLEPFLLTVGAFCLAYSWSFLLTVKLLCLQWLEIPDEAEVKLR